MGDINTYLINQDGKDWADLLSGWADLLPEEFTLWMVNRFGDLIIVLENGSVHLLDVGVGTLVQIADSREHCYEVIDQGDNTSNWLMAELVDDCLATGMSLLPSQCYSYKIHPMLGGSYSVDNIEPADLSAHYSFLAEIRRQIRDVPDGTKVRVVIGKPPQ